MPSAASLREDLLSIWMAGIDAVRAPQLMRNALHYDHQRLSVCDDSWSWDELERIVVIGAGKAGAGMAGALEEILGPEIVDARVTGWINVPADCVRPLRRIVLHPGRPAGVNEPTEEGLFGSERILELARTVGPRDLCLVLLSGGGSALLPAPIKGISLADKQTVTRFLMTAGATINELNGVRKRLSRIKGGGLARACTQGHRSTLIISDVVGDPLDVIASGPTTVDPTSPQQALEILHKFHAAPPQVPRVIFDVLEKESQTWNPPSSAQSGFRNTVIGNNAVALSAAGKKAVELGYRVISCGSDNQGEASEVGRELAQQCVALQGDANGQRPICILSGGEPVVHLTDSSHRGKGGRNQQLVLAALDALWDRERHSSSVELGKIGILSGGTDGEDGPTDAAGAYLDVAIRDAAISKDLDPRPYLERCDAYNFFSQAGGLIKTGPTHTNVMDLRVCLIRR